MPDPRLWEIFLGHPSGGDRPGHSILDTDGGVPTTWKSALWGGVPSLSQGHKDARIGGSKGAPSWLWRTVRGEQKHARETWRRPIMRVFPPGGTEAVGWGNSVLTVRPPPPWLVPSQAPTCWPRLVSQLREGTATHSWWCLTMSRTHLCGSLPSHPHPATSDCHLNVAQSIRLSPSLPGHSHLQATTCSGVTHVLGIRSVSSFLKSVVPAVRPNGTLHKDRPSPCSSHF